MRKDESAAMAAVVVIKSRRTSATQDKYTSSVTHPSPVGQTQVPPVSEMILALTEIWRTRQYTFGQQVNDVLTMYAIEA